MNYCMHLYIWLYIIGSAKYSVFVNVYDIERSLVVICVFEIFSKCSSFYLCWWFRGQVCLSWRYVLNFLVGFGFRFVCVEAGIGFGFDL